MIRWMVVQALELKHTFTLICYLTSHDDPD